MIKKVILEITQEDIKKHYQECIDEQIEVILKPETLERYIDNSVRQRVDELVRHYLQENVYSRDVIAAMKKAFKEDKSFKALLKNILKMEISRIERQLSQLDD